MSVGEDVQSLLEIAAVTGTFGSEWERQVVETSYTGSSTQLMRTAALVRTMSSSEERIDAVVCQLESTTHKKEQDVEEKVKEPEKKESEVNFPPMSYEFKRKKSLVSLRRRLERTNSKSGLPMIQTSSDAKLNKLRRPTRILNEPLTVAQQCQNMNINKNNNNIRPAEILTQMSRRRADSLQIEQQTNEEKEQIIKNFNRNKLKKMARERFRKATKKIVNVQKWISCLNEMLVMIKVTLPSLFLNSYPKKDSDDQREKYATFTDLAALNYSSDLQKSGLSFDVSFYKAKTEVTLSSEVQHILSLPPEQRTNDQLQIVLYGLQNLRSFVEYPLHMQEKLCRVARLQTIPGSRVIIRQGHYAENFYFILSGAAAVSIIEKKTSSGEICIRTVGIMRRGASFGELALLHRSKRTATVTSQGTVQVLAIEREDFFDIFMSGQNPGDIPQHIRFLKRGVVIIEDSRKSDWIYIVKSGSCQVITQLKSVVGRVKKTAKTKYDREVPLLPKLSGSGQMEPKIDSGIKRSYTMVGKFPMELKRAITQYNDLIKVRSSTPIKSAKSLPSFVKDSKDRSTLENFNRIRKHSKAHFKRNIPMSAETERPEREKEVETTFVQVDHLKPRDVFGLSSLDFEDCIDWNQPTVSLISRGAECVMLSKKFFMKHANHLVKKHLRQILTLYPSHRVLQHNLQTKANWDLYKENIVKQAITPRSPRLR
ncbi:DgyrCDS4122 [Dimorphilus gyrociliatus]|uniref:DgyrCDS4122 n=1 Tax=Dimorphilus gyrociliatus TaxID=2664684 RepID=A0A7I8VFP9_9ANNE|nr:DgyrCDS4122 [Dimorphilus gyrociliatus]